MPHSICRVLPYHTIPWVCCRRRNQWLRWSLALLCLPYHSLHLPCASMLCSLCTVFTTQDLCMCHTLNTRARTRGHTDTRTAHTRTYTPCPRTTEVTRHVQCAARHTAPNKSRAALSLAVLACSVWLFPVYHVHTRGWALSLAVLACSVCLFPVHHVHTRGWALSRQRMCASLHLTSGCSPLCYVDTPATSSPHTPTHC